MSFFEPDDEPHTPRRRAPRRSRSSARGRRPPAHRTILERRAVATVAILIVAVVIALAVRGCQTSAVTGSLKDYNDGVASVIQASDQTGNQLFAALTRGNGSDATTIESQIDQAQVSAAAELDRTRGLDVPDEVDQAQRYLLLTLQMRHDAIANIAGEIQPALVTSPRVDVFDELATEMGRLLASDVIYNDYTVPAMVGALRAAGIAVGGLNEAKIAHGQVLPNAQWLTPDYIALELTGRLPPRTGKPAPGVHGHRMDSVSVDGAMLQSGTRNTVPDSPPPTFMCTFTNDGQDVETNVVVKVSVIGTSIRGLALVPQTTPGHEATAEVTLNSSPPKGTYTVSATVEQVPGETALTHNTLTFPVAFR